MEIEGWFFLNGMDGMIVMVIKLGCYGGTIAVANCDKFDVAEVLK